MLRQVYYSIGSPATVLGRADGGTRPLQGLGIRPDHLMVCINPPSPLLLFSRCSLNYALKNTLKIPRNICGCISMHSTKSIDYAVVIKVELEIYSILMN